MQRLSVQVTLTATGHGTSSAAGEDSPRTVAVSGRRLKATLTPFEALVPGGAAVHASLVLHDAEGLSFLPPGVQFEIWENGRVGYGAVLAWR